MLRTTILICALAAAFTACAPVTSDSTPNRNVPCSDNPSRTDGLDLFAMRQSQGTVTHLRNKSRNA